MECGPGTKILVDKCVQFLILLIHYHIRIDDLVYGSPRESFHNSVKRSVNKDS